MQFTQKETSLLKDLKSQEQVCIEKYNKYSMEAHDGQLKGLFNAISQREQQHLDTLTQIEGGTVPNMQAGGGAQQQQQPTFTATYKQGQQDQNKQHDCFLCNDALNTEKHVSSTYNTCVFEFRDTKIRDALNHIQKEEQQHGEQLYSYMAQNGMYNAQ